ncbi:MAG: hypothetical protein IJ796_02925 [Lachnospiraceae bacterium]|nr:hypothetical protein [Lachnospiraceae bacterium]
MQTLYTELKVNNEYELCEVPDEESKAAIEKALLNHRISYFIKWQKQSIFSRKKGLCVICVNESAIEEAEAIITQLCDEMGFQVRFLIKHSSAGDDLF